MNPVTDTLPILIHPSILSIVNEHILFGHIFLERALFETHHPRNPIQDLQLKCYLLKKEADTRRSLSWDHSTQPSQFQWGVPAWYRALRHYIWRMRKQFLSLLVLISLKCTERAGGSTFHILSPVGIRDRFGKLVHMQDGYLFSS